MYDVQQEFLLRSCRYSSALLTLLLTNSERRPDRYVDDTHVLDGRKAATFVCICKIFVFLVSRPGLRLGGICCFK